MSQFLKSDLAESNQQNQTLAQQLTRCQVQLQEERNKTIPTPSTNETALFDAESKVEELRATMVKRALINKHCVFRKP